MPGWKPFWVAVGGVSLLCGMCVCNGMCNAAKSYSIRRSGLRCYLEFIKAVMGENVVVFPPRLEWLQSWALLFRCKKTFCNYLGYTKIGCLIVNADTGVFKHPGVKRAKESVAKAGRFASREKLWIRRERIEALLKWTEVSSCCMRWFSRCIRY